MKFNEAYGLNKKVLEEGVWRTLPSGMRVKVASIRSPRYQTVLMRLRRKYADQLNIKDKEMVDRITCEAMAEAILLDWEGAEDENGQPIPYSQELAAKYLLKYEIFREEVSTVATGDDNYKVAEIGKK